MLESKYVRKYLITGPSEKRIIMSSKIDVVWFYFPGFFSRAWYHFTMIPIWILGFSFMYDYMKYFLIWYSQWSYPDIYTKMQGYSQLLRHAYSRLTATPGRILSICLKIDFKNGLRSWYHKWCPDFYSKVQLSARLLRHAYSRLTATPGRILSICLKIDFKNGLRSWYHKWCPDFYSKVQLLARLLRHAYSRNLSIPVCILRNRFTVDFKECFGRWYHKWGWVPRFLETLLFIVLVSVCLSFKLSFLFLFWLLLTLFLFV